MQTLHAMTEVLTYVPAIPHLGIPRNMNHYLSQEANLW